jgi:hypothetical protein
MLRNPPVPGNQSHAKGTSIHPGGVFNRKLAPRYSKAGRHRKRLGEMELSA